LDRGNRLGLEGLRRTRLDADRRHEHREGGYAVTVEPALDESYRDKRADSVDLLDIHVFLAENHRPMVVLIGKGHLRPTLDFRPACASGVI
jgi:hypothetical protein